MKLTGNTFDCPYLSQNTNTKLAVIITEDSQLSTFDTVCWNAEQFKDQMYHLSFRKMLQLISDTL